MGNILSEDGVDKDDINEIRQITQTTSYYMRILFGTVYLQ